MPTPTRFPWLLAGLITAGLTLAAVSGLRLPEPTAAHPGSKPPLPAETSLEFGPSANHATLTEEMNAIDPTPLFLPTRWNSGQAVLPGALRQESGKLAAMFDPKLLYELDHFGVSIPVAVPVPSGATEGLGLTERADAPLALGRAETTPPRLSSRLGVVEAVETGTGEVVLTAALPAADSAPGGDWQQPLELLGRVTPGGLAGDLTVVSGSGLDERDEYFRHYLARVFHVGERLPPGNYMIRVGP